MADVEVEVEIRIVDPVRMVELEGHLDEPATHRLEASDQRIEPFVGGLVRIEVAVGSFVDRQAVHVTVRVGRFHVEEARVEAGQLFHAGSLAPTLPERHPRTTSQPDSLPVYRLVHGARTPAVVVPGAQGRGNPGVVPGAQGRGNHGRRRTAWVSCTTTNG